MTPHLNLSEQRELRRGGYIMRQFRLKSTGETYWVELKQSWDRLYFRCDGGPWCKSATEAIRWAAL